MASDVLKEIHAERRRQKRKLGWTHKHDDEHPKGTLVKAALAFASSAIGRRSPAIWKSHRTDRTPREKLIRAAALIIAEIEAMDREASHAR